MRRLALLALLVLAGPVDAKHDRTRDASGRKVVLTAEEYLRQTGKEAKPAPVEARAEAWLLLFTAPTPEPSYPRRSSPRWHRKTYYSGSRRH